MKVAVLKRYKQKVVWPWAILITLLLVIAIPIGLVYGLFYDNSTKNVYLQPEMTADTLGNRVLVDSLDQTADTHNIDLVVTENDVDNLIHYGLEKSNYSSKLVKKSYVHVYGNRYQFFADIDLTYFKTRIRFDTLLGESEDHQDFIFAVQDITIGRMSGYKEISKSAAGAFINENSVNHFLSKTGLSMKYEEKNMRFVYHKIDALKDMATMVKTEGTDLYYVIMKNMIADNLVEYDFHADDFINAKLDCSMMRSNSLVTDDTSHMRVSAEQVTTRCRDKLVKLVNDRAFDPELVNPAIVFQYLFAGWNAISPESKAIIEDINMGAIGITNKTQYQGFNLYHASNSLQSRLNNSVNVNNLVSKNSSINKRVSTIKESEINRYLAGTGVVGYTTVLGRYKEDGKYKANYVTIDNFYCNLYTESTRAIAEFVCKLNINGYHTSMTISSKAVGASARSGKSIIYTIDEVKYGAAGGEHMQSDILALLSDALEKGDGAMVAIEADNTIRFNFEQNLDYTCEACEDKVYENTGYRYSFTNYFKDSNIKFNTTGSSRSDDGTIYVSLVQGIDY